MSVTKFMLENGQINDRIPRSAQMRTVSGWCALRSSNKLMRFHIARCYCYRWNGIRWCFVSGDNCDCSIRYISIALRWLMRWNNRWIAVIKSNNGIVKPNERNVFEVFWQLTDASYAHLHDEVGTAILVFGRAYPHTRLRAALFLVSAPPAWLEMLVYPIVDYCLTELMLMMW